MSFQHVLLNSRAKYVENFVDNHERAMSKWRLHKVKFVCRSYQITNTERMFSTILKKKLSNNQVANVFINAIFDSVDSGWKEIALLINEDPAFIESPNISEEDSGLFGLIIIVGNLSFLESTFDNHQVVNIERIIFQKLSKIYGVTESQFQDLIREYQSFIKRVNRPSKNMVYGMSKAVFHKYNLNEFQDEYFKRLQNPNPLFLKRMDEVMKFYIWNWDAFLKKYKINS